jgi:hypothetical protein
MMGCNNASTMRACTHTCSRHQCNDIALISCTRV